MDVSHVSNGVYYYWRDIAMYKPMVKSWTEYTIVDDMNKVLNMARYYPSVYTGKNMILTQRYSDRFNNFYFRGIIK